MRWRMCRLTKKTTVKFKCGKVQVEYFWAITLPSLHSDMDDDKKKNENEKMRKSNLDTNVLWGKSKNWENIEP